MKQRASVVDSPLSTAKLLMSRVTRSAVFARALPPHPGSGSGSASGRATPTTG